VLSRGQPIYDAAGAVTAYVGLNLDITERQRAEEERERLFNRMHKLSFETQRQADELNAMFNSMAEPLLIYDREGHVAKVNASALEALGFSPLGLKQDRIESHLAFQPLKSEGEDGGEWIAARALRGETVKDCYYTLSGPGRQDNIILASAAPIRSWGRNQGAVVVWHDMTAQMRVEEMLRRSQERYQFLYEESQAFNMIVGLDEAIKDINQSAWRALGYSREELIGKSVRDLVPEGQRERLCGIIRAAIDGKLTEGLDVQVKAKAGALRTIMFSPGKAALHEYYGRVSGIIFTGIDITERKQAEEALKKAHDELEMQVAERTADLVNLNAQLNLEIQERKEIERQTRESQALLERIFANTNFLIAYLDTRFNFIRVNQAYAQQDGREPDYYVGKNHFDLYPCMDPRHIFEEVIRTGKPYAAHEKSFGYPFCPERGTTYWDWSVQPVKDPDGGVEGLVLCLVDVTKRMQAEKELYEAQIKLGDAKRLSDIGTLAAIVAHELRNPLGVIRASAYNIRRKRLNSEIDKHLFNIDKKIVESSQIINNLLNYSRIKPPQFEKVSLASVLEECAATVRGAFLNQPIALEFQCESLRTQEIEADPVQLREVFGNLLANAYQAMHNRAGKIIVEGHQERKNVARVSMKDEGIGIDPEDLSRVFDPFFTTKSKGTGLGLTICNEIVNLHGGKIEINSMQDRGTTITVSLPMQRNLP